jgi:hypothetical protein
VEFTLSSRRLFHRIIRTLIEMHRRRSSRLGLPQDGDLGKALGTNTCGGEDRDAGIDKERIQVVRDCHW